MKLYRYRFNKCGDVEMLEGAITGCDKNTFTVESECHGYHDFGMSSTCKFDVRVDYVDRYASEVRPITASDGLIDVVLSKPDLQMAKVLAMRKIEKRDAEIRRAAENLDAWKKSLWSGTIKGESETIDNGPGMKLYVYKFSPDTDGVSWSTRTVDKIAGGVYFLDDGSTVTSDKVVNGIPELVDTKYTETTIALYLQEQDLKKAIVLAIQNYTNCMSNSRYGSTWLYRMTNLLQYEFKDADDKEEGEVYEYVE